MKTASRFLAALLLAGAGSAGAAPVLMAPPSQPCYLTLSAHGCAAATADVRAAHSPRNGAYSFPTDPLALDAPLFPADPLAPDDQLNPPPANAPVQPPPAPPTPVPEPPQFLLLLAGILLLGLRSTRQQASEKFSD